MIFALIFFRKEFSFCVAVGAFAAYPFVSFVTVSSNFACRLELTLADLFRKKYFLLFHWCCILLLVVYLLLYELNVMCIFHLLAITMLFSFSAFAGYFDMHFSAVS